MSIDFFKQYSKSDLIINCALHEELWSNVFAKLYYEKLSQYISWVNEIDKLDLNWFFLGSHGTKQNVLPRFFFQMKKKVNLRIYQKIKHVLEATRKNPDVLQIPSW